MSLNPLTFTGISQYSQDFQTILQRVTTIASFPLTQLRNEQSDTAARRQLTNELNSGVRLLGEKMTALKEVAGNRAVSASSSNSSKLTVDSVNTDILTSYSITDVTSLAAAASETSSASYADSSATTVSASGSLKLKVGTAEYDFTLSSGENNLVGLRNKINGLGAGVTASILTVGENENYLSITANNTGANPIELREDPAGVNTNLITSANPGSSLNFRLNGVAVTRPSNQVNDLVPGVTFSLKQTTAVSETLTIGLSSDRSKLSAAISGFVDAYNAVQAKVNGQVGANAGLLSGDILVREAQDILRRAASFSIGEGTVKNWADIGVSFEQTGEIALDLTAFNALSDSRIRDAFSFFRDTTGLGAQTARTEAFSNAVTGLAAIQLAQFDRTDSRLSEQIASLEDRINLVRENYLQKLQTADALLGSFESQQNIISASVDSLSLVLYGKREG
jgi:flagellar hook-associated protein 2